MRGHDFSTLAMSCDMANRIKELREAAGLTQDALAALAGTTKNQLTKLESGARRLSDHWAQRLAPHLDVQPFELFMPADAVKPLRSVALVGNISCGDWQEAVENAPSYVPGVDGGTYVFALKAQGDSMNKLIADEGYVYVDPDETNLLDGRIYAVMNGDGETTCKMYKNDPARLVPCSDNPAYKEMLLGGEPCTVIGRVIGSFTPH